MEQKRSKGATFAFPFLTHFILLIITFLFKEINTSNYLQWRALTLFFLTHILLSYYDNSLLIYVIPNFFYLIYTHHTFRYHIMSNLFSSPLRHGSCLSHFSRLPILPYSLALLLNLFQHISLPRNSSQPNRVPF